MAPQTRREQAEGAGEEEEKEEKEEEKEEGVERDLRSLARRPEPEKKTARNQATTEGMGFATRGPPSERCPKLPVEVKSGLRPVGRCTQEEPTRFPPVKRKFVMKMRRLEERMEVGKKKPACRGRVWMENGTQTGGAKNDGGKRRRETVQGRKRRMKRGRKRKR